MRRAQITVAERVLELGVGSGGTLSYLAEHGVDIEGCDISEPVAKQSEERCGRKVWPCAIGEVPGKFDTIIANHVLEHQSDPTQFLLELIEKLSPGGKLLLAVPNVASIGALFERWVGYQPYHLVYFTPRTLQDIAVTAGFEVMSQGTYESITSWSLLARGRRTDCVGLESGRQSGRARLLRVAGIGVGLALSPLRWLAGALGRGDEAYALFRKP